MIFSPGWVEWGEKKSFFPFPPESRLNVPRSGREFLAESPKSPQNKYPKCNATIYQSSSCGAAAV